MADLAVGAFAHYVPRSMGSKGKHKVIQGTVRRSAMVGGTAWELHAGDDVYELDSTDPALLKEGQRVEVEGDIAEDQMSFTMTGPILRVTRFKVV